ncbi:MAG TPA: hypothetical protein VFV50_14695 [Bdellovibrionales bacterium]|nr:hypothetical protein [Bdellovibrionales bacterium]
MMRIVFALFMSLSFAAQAGEQDVYRALGAGESPFAVLKSVFEKGTAMKLSEIPTLPGMMKAKSGLVSLNVDVFPDTKAGELARGAWIFQAPLVLKKVVTPPTTGGGPLFPPSSGETQVKEFVAIIWCSYAPATCVESLKSQNASLAQAYDSFDSYLIEETPAGLVFSFKDREGTARYTFRRNGQYVVMQAVLQKTRQPEVVKYNYHWPESF